MTVSKVGERKRQDKVKNAINDGCGRSADDKKRRSVVSCRRRGGSDSVV